MQSSLCIAERPHVGIPQGFAAHAERNLPRYTSYPTALAFHDGVGAAEARAWAQGIATDQPISIYAHIPFCEQLCWYCACNTTVPNGYRRISSYLARLHREIELWAEALGPHGGGAHLHFGGGSPNSLLPEDFAELVATLKSAFRVRSDAEIAVELDPRALDAEFVEALRAGGVNRASLGVQTLDPVVQAKINRIQPLEHVAWATSALRQAGVEGLNFDLMYGLPAQTPESAAESARLAAGLTPDRISVFGYAHVPWFKKHQKLIDEAELAGLEGRWAQAEAIDAVLVGEGYERIGLDHYARRGDPLALAAAEGRLRRNFQGYTTDPAEVLIPLGASAIGRFPDGYVQNRRDPVLWAEAIEAGELAIDRGVGMTAEDRLRAHVIERLMCDLTVDAGEACAAFGFAAETLDEGVAWAELLESDGLCRVEGRRVTIRPEARRLMRAVAYCFDAGGAPERRHSKAV
jgi:oxygen-independent coproporphyrinogen-3 oxidase